MISVLELREKRGHSCEWCHEREGTVRHHCLIHDTKRFHKELTVEENLMLACEYCHTGVCILNSLDVRLWFWQIQCKRYGVEHMLTWVYNLPEKLHYSGRLTFLKQFEEYPRVTLSVPRLTG